MDSSLWLIRRTVGATVLTQTPAEWGIDSSSIKIEFLAQSADALTFTLRRDFDDDDSFPFGCTVELLRVVGETITVVFLGRIVRAPRQGSSESESLDYEAEGPWWWLDHLVFEQAWRFPSGLLPDGSFSLLDKPLTRLLLGRSLAGDKVPASAILTEVFDFLADKFSTPLSLGELAADFATEIPCEEVRDLTCGEVIRRVLRWFPGITPRLELSPGACAIHFRARGVERFTLNPGLQDFGTVSLTPRHDLRPSCVLVRYARNSLFEAAEITPEVFEDKWPVAADAYAVDAIRLVVQLDGGSINTLSTKVKTEAIATDRVEWWQTKLPYLNLESVSAITVVPGSPVVVADADAPEDATVYPRELIDGSLPLWTNTRQTPAIAKAKLTYTVALEGGGSETRTEAVQVRLRSTDATQSVYSWVTDYQAPEPIPSGLARRYFEALDRLQYDGSITLDQGEWDGVNRVGYALDLAGFPKRPEWASMAASVVRQTVDLHSGRVTLSVGPATHLMPDDWISLARPARGRTHSTQFAASTRATGRLQAALPPAPTENLPRAVATTLVLSPSTGTGGAPVTPMAFEATVTPIDADPGAPGTQLPTEGVRNRLWLSSGKCNGKFARYVNALGSPVLPTGYGQLTELNTLTDLFAYDNNGTQDVPNNRWHSDWWYVWIEYDAATKRTDIKTGATDPEANNQTLLLRVRTTNPFLIPGDPDSYAPYWDIEIETVNTGDQFIIAGGSESGGGFTNFIVTTRPTPDADPATQDIVVSPGAVGARVLDKTVISPATLPCVVYLRAQYTAWGSESQLRVPSSASVESATETPEDDNDNAYLQLASVDAEGVVTQTVGTSQLVLRLIRVAATGSHLQYFWRVL